MKREKDHVERMIRERMMQLTFDLLQDTRMQAAEQRGRDMAYACRYA